MVPLLDYPPVLVISLGPFAVYTWGLFVALGVLAATWLAARRAARAGIPRAVVWDGAFWVVIAGLIGARVLYVAEYWRDFAGEPLRAFAFWEGGMSAFGSVILAPVVAVWYARRRRLDVGKVLNAAAPAALLADAVGRLGGAASHMYPGKPTSFPLSYVLDGVQRHEVGIELALASLAGVLVILAAERYSSFFIRHSSFPALLALLWYAAERFLLDFLRASDLPTSDLRYGGLTLAQYASLGGLALVTALLTRARRRATLRSP